MMKIAEMERKKAIQQIKQAEKLVQVIQYHFTPSRGAIKGWLTS
jgi:hypothetical protein